VGSVPIGLAAELKRSLELGRAVETGTYLGDGARRLADILATAVTIEPTRAHVDRLEKRRSR
jgi:hypothetical protein